MCLGLPLENVEHNSLSLTSVCEEKAELSWLKQCLAQIKHSIKQNCNTAIPGPEAETSLEGSLSPKWRILLGP
jgi:hypothetical protein